VEQSPTLRFPAEKDSFLLPSPLQTWKQTYWRVMQTSQSYWACSKLWTRLDGQRVKGGTQRRHFALIKGKQEFVWFGNLTTLKFCWLCMNQASFFLRHLYRHWEVLKYVCMVYELTVRYICHGSSEAVFNTQSTFMNCIKMTNLRVILKTMLRCQWKCVCNGCNEH